MDSISPVHLNPTTSTHPPTSSNLSLQDTTGNGSIQGNDSGPLSSLSPSQDSHQSSSPQTVSIPPNHLLLAGVSHAAAPATLSHPPMTFPSLTSSSPAPQSHPDPHPRRPSPPPRSTSFQKRHASFDSPREIPLPSPSLQASTRSSFFSPPSIPPPSSKDNQPSSTPTFQATSTSSSQSDADLSMGRFQLHSRTQTSSSNTSTGSEYAATQARSTSWSRLHRDSSSSQGSTPPSDSTPDPYMVFEEDVERGSGGGSGGGSTATSPEPSPTVGPREQRMEALVSAPGSVRRGSGFGMKEHDVASGRSGEMGMSPESFGIAPGSHKGKGKAIDPLPSMTGLLFPNSRPYSLPPAVPSNEVTDEPLQSGTVEPRSRAWIDRSSSASLPLPTQIPYHTLPQTSSGNEDTVQEGVEWHSRTENNDSSRRDAIYGPHSFERPPLESQSSTGSSGSSSSDSQQSAPTGPQHVPGQLAFSRAALGIPPELYNPQSAPVAPRTYSSPNTTLRQQSDMPPIPPQPLAQTQSHSPRLTQSFWQYTQRLPTPQMHGPTSSSSSSSLGVGVGYASSSSATSIISSPSSRPSSASGPGASGPNSFPPPEPPVILPADSTEGDVRSTASRNAPYAPFLCRMPPPPNSWIEVETSASEYKLVVRLPGFRRECITLATKRRRILHVVADSWEQNGGHFERRISFGYDADLTQVRAEFDGTLLKVSIPRRLPSVSMWNGDTLRSTGRAR